jgi:hypothetical protein
MSLKKLALILALLITGSLQLSAQETRCSLKLTELPSIPELRGFHPGMTIDEVRERLPKVQIRRADEFGFTTFNIFPDYETAIDKKAFENVRSITLEFLDGRASMVWIGYDNSFRWQTVDEFTSALTAALKLPLAWRSKFRTRVLVCADFTLTVIPVGESTSLKITDEAARELLEKRKAAKEEIQP